MQMYGSGAMYLMLWQTTSSATHVLLRLYTSVHSTCQAKAVSEANLCMTKDEVDNEKVNAFVIMSESVETSFTIGLPW